MTPVLHQEVPAQSATLGVIGGTGFERFLDDMVEVEVDTPWGAPSAPITIGQLGGRAVAFVPRHGTEHQLSPARIPYKANLWALRAVGVRRVFAACASGSLQPHLVPGDFVICDQLVDRTSGRADTYFDGEVVNHVGFADPFCPELRAAAHTAGIDSEATVHERGTVVVIQGPRFSTRAESVWFRQNDWDVVNMTQYPESILARELGLCYATVAMVTDFDSGVEGDLSRPPVTQEGAYAVMRLNADRVRSLLAVALTKVPIESSCSCAEATNGILP